jgi:hypothetical protein
VCVCLCVCVCVDEGGLIRCVLLARIRALKQLKASYTGSFS